jgi:hypothetical protein
MTTWLLVHSPLVGPSTWASVASAARSRGIESVVPDLSGVGAADEPMCEYFVSTAAGGKRSLRDVLVIGHSGAGVFLPAIGDRLAGQLLGLLFVDAVIPPTTGHHSTPVDQASLLDEKTHDGVLENWFDWWPDGVIEDLVPDAELLDRLRANSPRLPRKFYDEPVPVPLGWADWSCGYLRLSTAYDSDLDEARRREWPTLSLEENHLTMATKPEMIVDALSTVADSMRSRGGGGDATPN